MVQSRTRSAYASRRAEARQRVDELLRRLTNGDVESEVTLATFAEAWLSERRRKLSPATATSYEVTYRAYIEPHLGDLPLRCVTVSELNTWINTLLKAGGRRGQPLAVRTVHGARSLVHNIFEDAVRDGSLLVNPVARTEPPRCDVYGRRRRYPARVWSRGELRTFIDEAARHRLGPVFTLLGLTGMRRAEVLALTWPDVDLDLGEITIRRSLSVRNGKPVLGPTKSARTRRIALGHRATTALSEEQQRQQAMATGADRAWTNDQNLIFASPTGSHLKPESITDAFRRFIPRLDVRRIRLHDLRHTHAVLMLQAGVSLVDVSHRLGHANPATTLELYAYALEDPGHTAAATFDQLIQAGKGRDGVSNLPASASPLLPQRVFH